MTPGINVAKHNNISYTVHEYAQSESCEAYGLDAAIKMAVPEEQVFKTLVVSLDSKELVVGIIPVSSMLSMKLIAKACQVRKASMANKAEVERSTGYILGGVSPLGQKKTLRTFIDPSARNYGSIYVSAGRRGLEIELSPDDLQKLTQAKFVKLCQ